MKKALLLSGGIDSNSIAWVERPEITITVNYGQKSAKTEISSAKEISRLINADHHIIEVDCSSLGSGDMSVHKPNSNAPSSEWWPYRNQMLITLAAMKSISLNVKELMIGCISSDDFHKDGTKEFIKKISDLLEYQEGSLKITAPAIEFKIHDYIAKHQIPLSFLMWSHSCHKSNIPCNSCRGCNKYNQTMELIG